MESKGGKYLKNIGAVFGYLALHLGVQVACGTVLTILFMISAIASGRAANMEELAVKMLQDNSTLILIFSSAVTLLTVFLIARSRREGFGSFCGFARIPAREAALCLLAGVAGNVWLSMLLYMLPIPASVMEQYGEAYSALTSSVPWLDALATVLAAPLVEEVIYRGLIMKHLGRIMPVAAAVAVQALLFGAGHGALLWIAYAAAIGVIMAYIRVVTGSLWSSLLFHIAFNASAYLVDWLAENVLTDASLPGVLAASAAALGLLLFAVYRSASRREQSGAEL